MMTEISLNVLDVAENSTRANAKLVEISVQADTKADTLTIIIKDDGSGMSKEQIKKVEDPFFTTRTTRKVGLGVPFFKQAAEATFLQKKALELLSKQYSDFHILTECPLAI